MVASCLLFLNNLQQLCSVLWPLEVFSRIDHICLLIRSPLSSLHAIWFAHLIILASQGEYKVVTLQQSVICLFIHLVVCLTTGPKPLPKRALHIVRSRASSFKWEYPLLSLRSSNSFLRLLPCLPVTSIPPCIFPSVTRCRRQFLLKCDQSSSPSVYVFHVGYSSAPWL